MNLDNEVQWLAVCHTVMKIAKRGDLWTQKGPTEEALELREKDGGPLSSGERVMLLVTFAFWDADMTLRFRELSRLSSENLFAVGSLLAAIAVDRMQLPEAAGESCVDTWLTEEVWLIR